MYIITVVSVFHFYTYYMSVQLYFYRVGQKRDTARTMYYNVRAVSLFLAHPVNVLLMLRRIYTLHEMRPIATDVTRN